MKIRNGFVSNSSSTSYIIVVKKTEPCPHCKQGGVDFLDLLSKRDDGSCDNTMYIKDREQILNELEKEIEVLSKNPLYYWGSVERSKEFAARQLLVNKNLIEKINTIPEGTDVAEIRISHHDLSWEKLFKELVANGSLIILDTQD